MSKKEMFEGFDESRIEEYKKEVDPSDSEVQALIEQHHKYINDRFYTCTSQIYNGFADLYVDDSRFEAYFEKRKTGLAEFMHKAMKIYREKISNF
ncbi:MAG: TipAS antibiotic-recognition domain-containing protein [Halanaerobiales bacterium]|nr:TipAS antibiotic-recognition domain-containing protein [Halanaerobiales bacterium]